MHEISTLVFGDTLQELTQAAVNAGMSFFNVPADRVIVRMHGSVGDVETHPDLTHSKLYYTHAEITLDTDVNE